MGNNFDDDEFRFDDDDEFDDDLNFGDDDEFGLGGDDDFALDDDEFLADASSGGGMRRNNADFGSDDFGFDDDNEFGLDDDLDNVDVGFGMDEDTPEDLGGEEAAGTSSGFMRWLIILGGLLVLQIIIIVALLLMGSSARQNELEATRAAIISTNDAVATTASFRETNSAIQATTETARLSVTPTPTATSTNTRIPTFTPTPTLDETSAAATNQIAALTQTPAALTAQAETLTAQPTNTLEGPGPEEIFATSTELARVFLSITETAEAVANAPTGEAIIEDMPTLTPTQIQFLGETAGTGLINQGQLPNAGLFDEFAAGNSLGLIALAAVGLLGVIVFSRRIRKRNDEDNE